MTNIYINFDIDSEVPQEDPISSHIVHHHLNAGLNKVMA